MAVRSFYLDIVQWALNDPGRWALWAAPSPVTAADTAGVKKQHRRQQAEMRQRTRTLAPLLPALIATAERRHHDARCLHDTAQSAAVGQRFDVAGIGYERIARWSHYSDGDRRPAVRRLPDDAIVQTFQREDETFWAWAIVEVLRHTGIRSEELLELTHLSIRRYTQPDGEVIPLMQVAPSKTDAERVLPVAPELASVLARVITRISDRDGVVPLVARYDGPERRWLPAQPHLFQRRFGGKPAVINPDCPPQPAHRARRRRRSHRRRRATGALHPARLPPHLRHRGGQRRPPRAHRPAAARSPRLEHHERLPQPSTHNRSSTTTGPSSTADVNGDPTRSTGPQPPTSGPNSNNTSSCDASRSARATAPTARLASMNTPASAARCCASTPPAGHDSKNCMTTSPNGSTKPVT